ncbi:MAG: hypothetical protein RIR70_475 [Pseudomonadota bacterium]|jgi:FemAB-related protein (PEP-CTERM system-associated)
MKLDAVLRVREACRVKCLTESDCARWDEFVMRCEEASFFHRSQWAGILEEVFGARAYFLYAEQGGVIEGVLPLALVESWLTSRALISLPFCIEAGVAAVSPAAREALLREATLIAAQLGVDHLEIRSRRLIDETWPTQDLYVRFDKPILPAAEDNLAAIPRKQRAMVRKGIAANLAGVIDEDVTRFHALYLDNMHRHGSPAQPLRYFKRLRQAFGDDCQVLTVESPDGKPVSSVLSFYFRDTVLPYYAGDVIAARGLYANDFKYWALMEAARERGARCFDYGRSKVGSGSWSFKKNWGCESAPLYYQYPYFKGAPEVPQHNPNNPRYALLIRLWQRMPRSLTARLGPPLARHFP